MVCGDCVCDSSWLPGGQQVFLYTCGAAGSGGSTGVGGQTGMGGASSTSAGGALGLGGNMGVGGEMGLGGESGIGGNTGTGGSTVTCDEGAIEDSPSSLIVDIDGAEQPVHKEIFGLLMEILGNDINNGIYVGTNSSIPNTNGIRDDIIEGFREAGVGAIEWPGGCAANGYDWENDRNPSNTMGTDLFMEFCEAVGAEPVLVGRPRPEFADSNRSWVEYVNNNPSHPEWNLKYFKIGNEVWGCGGDLGTDYDTYETWYNAHHELLDTPVNGKDLFLIGATGGIWTVNPNTTNWLTTMVEPGRLGNKIDGVEIHDYVYFPDTYPCVGFSDNQYYDVVNRANQAQMAPRVRDVDTILDRVDPDNRLKIIEDEWGDWLMEWDASDTWLQMGTLMDALSAAQTLNMFMAHADRVQMAGLAQAVNVIHALFLTNSRTGGTDLVKTPTFYVFKMFVPHHVGGARFAPNQLSSENINGNGQNFPVLSSAATVNDAREVTISLTNVDLVNSREITVELESAIASYVVSRAEIITGSAKDSYNDFGQAETVSIQPLAESAYQHCGRTLKVTLPSKSVVTLTLKPG